MGQSEQSERLLTELSLLEAMYPAQITWNETNREFKYISNDRSFQLRLPENYLLDQLPEVLFARIEREDVRQNLRQQIQTCSYGEEVLDSIILAFTEFSGSIRSEGGVDGCTEESSEVNADRSDKATMIIWLHHLLNTNKRKQALSPASNSVSGVTKPGYPGVLVYSGPSEAVHAHVNELKQLNWQAFQIRYENEEEWKFAHGAGVKEVETMKEIVAEVGDERKPEFMEAMRMR